MKRLKLSEDGEEEVWAGKWGTYSSFWFIMVLLNSLNSTFESRVPKCRALYSEIEVVRFKAGEV